MRLQSFKLVVRTVAAVLTAATSLAFASFLPSSLTQATSADWVKTGKNTGLGTSGIASPVVSSGEDQAWQGSYVYLGNFGGKPIRFRVLDPATDRFGGETMLVDSDEVLFDYVFDVDGNNVWKDPANYVYSDLYMYLNFKFVYDSFAPAEIAAVFPSTTEDLDDDKIFVLSDNEIEAYGSAAKTGGLYWLRSADTAGADLINVVDSQGTVTKAPVSSKLGVAPALNIDLNRVVFSSLVSGNPGAGAAYKLTLLDKDIELAVKKDKDVSVDGNSVTVPYELKETGASAVNQMSVLILSSEYNVSDSDNTILYYAPLGSNDKAQGIGTFDLPKDLDLSGWGSDYRVYILAEDINGALESDYTSEPVEVVLH